MAKSRGGGSKFLDALPEDGERRLMLAVLIDAIRSYAAHRPTTPHIRAYRAWLRDRAWFQSDAHSEPFSFVNICDALGLDAGYVRRCVLRPQDSQPPVRVRRYAASVKDTWARLQRDNALRAQHTSFAKAAPSKGALPPRHLAASP